MTVQLFPWWRRLTAGYLRSLPTLRKGHTDDLKLDTGSMRCWLARTGVADGEPFENRVSVEVLNDGLWTAVEDFAG